MLVTKAVSIEWILDHMMAEKTRCTAQRIRIDRVRNEPRSYPVVEQARFKKALFIKEIAFSESCG